MQSIFNDENTIHIQKNNDGKIKNNKDGEMFVLLNKWSTMSCELKVKCVYRGILSICILKYILII